MKRTIDKKGMRNFGRTICETQGDTEFYKKLGARVFIKHKDDGTVEYCAVSAMYHYFFGEECPWNSTQMCIDVILTKMRCSKHNKQSLMQMMHNLVTINDTTFDYYNRAKQVKAHVNKIAKLLA